MNLKHTMNEKEKLNMSLKSKNSSGYDEICTKILKISCPYVSLPLNYICSKVLSMGIFPDRLKYSIIKPFYVIGNKHGMSNVRPVSLVTSL